METGLVRGGEALGVFQVCSPDGIGLGDVVSKSLKSMEGIKSVVVNYVTDKVYVSYDPSKISPWRIRRSIADAGARAAKTSQGHGRVGLGRVRQRECHPG